MTIPRRGAWLFVLAGAAGGIWLGLRLFAWLAGTPT